MTPAEKHRLNLSKLSLVEVGLIAMAEAFVERNWLNWDEPLPMSVNGAKYWELPGALGGTPPIKKGPIPVEPGRPTRPFTVKTYGGPWDPASKKVAPFAVDRFDLSRETSATATVLGTLLVRDILRFLFTFAAENHRHDVFYDAPPALMGTHRDLEHEVAPNTPLDPLLVYWTMDLCLVEKA